MALENSAYNMLKEISNIVSPENIAKLKSKIEKQNDLDQVSCSGKSGEKIIEQIENLFVNIDKIMDILRKVVSTTPFKEDISISDEPHVLDVLECDLRNCDHQTISLSLDMLEEYPFLRTLLYENLFDLQNLLKKIEDPINNDEESINNDEESIEKLVLNINDKITTCRRQGVGQAEVDKGVSKKLIF